MNEQPVTILQVMHENGRRVVDDQGRMVFEIVADGANTGERGNLFELRELAGPLTWRYSRVVILETGEVPQRDAHRKT